MPSVARNQNIDLLRVLGLAMIILAHVGSTTLIEQIRNFDVPLMVLLSGASFALSQRNESYFDFCVRRLRRLIIPVWTFLTIYFISWYFLFPLSLPKASTIVTSYTLTSGIGYVWIIRIFAIVAILSPLIITTKNRLGSYFLPAFAASLIAYELTLIASRPYSGTLIGKIFDLAVIYPLPYCLVFALGHTLTQIKTTTMVIMISICGVVFIGYSATIAHHHGSFIPTEEFKFPPSVYYFSYALLVALPLWMLAPKIKTSPNTHLWKIIEFISKNSIWVYLWHIPLVNITSPSIPLRLLITFLGATLLAYIQIEITLNRILLPKVSSIKLRENLIAVFSG